MEKQKDFSQRYLISKFFKCMYCSAVLQNNHHLFGALVCLSFTHFSFFPILNSHKLFLLKKRTLKRLYDKNDKMISKSKYKTKRL